MVDASFGIVAGRISGVIALSVIVVVILGWIALARRGRIPKLRELAPIKAIEEGVGRATEMNRPVLFAESLPNYKLYGAWAAAIIASLTILDYLARLCVKYKANLITCLGRTETLPMVQRITSEAFTSQGQKYDPANILFFPEQAYTAGVSGAILKMKPATCVYSGMIVHEAVIFGEAGNLIGAFQIAAGTAINNIPFLITTCDFTLIGEELYSGAAIVSGHPIQLGSIAGQDFCKYLIMAIVVAGVALISLGSRLILNLLSF